MPTKWEGTDLNKRRKNKPQHHQLKRNKTECKEMARNAIECKRNIVIQPFKVYIDVMIEMPEDSYQKAEALRLKSLQFYAQKVDLRD